MTAWLLASTGGGVPASRASAGSFALLIIALLAVATVLLIRNMNGRLKKMPKEFPAERAAREAREAREPREDDQA